jgi:hypothetical protein
MMTDQRAPSRPFTNSTQSCLLFKTN